jgi:phage recombination protein Bet
MAQAQPPAPTEGTAKVVTYTAKDGQEVKLTIDVIKRYLVTGNKDLVSAQEFVYFMGICKSRGLNPFARDCYLIKYTASDPAAIITAIDFYRSRARAMPDCVGWEKGIIVQKENGEVRYSKGLLLGGEKLVGGWFKAHPKGWEVPFELEINLEGYIKRTKDGSITRFWQPANQPTMIAKVAESQGLRTLWPDLFRGTISAEEYGVALDQFETIDITAIGAGESAEEPPPDTSEFDKLVADKESTEEEQLQNFLAFCAENNSKRGKTVTVDMVKVEAAKAFDRFWQAFEKWMAKKEPRAGRQSQAPPPEPDRQEPQGAEGNQGQVQDPEVVDAEMVDEGEIPPPVGEPVDMNARKKHIQTIELEANKKGILGLLFKQFKVNSMQDFLAMPDMIPTAEKFVADAKGK